MIKILNIIPPGLIVDGITMCEINYYKNMDKKSIEMDFAGAFILDSISNELEQINAKFYQLKSRNKNPIGYFIKLRKLIKNNQYDIVKVNGSSSLLFIEMMAAKLAGCKIRIVHSRNTTTRHPFLDKIFRPIFYHSYNYAFACGKEAGEWLFRKKQKFIIINNGKDFEKFKFDLDKRKKYRNKYNIEDDFVIGHVGTFNYQKNHEFLIDIFYEILKKNEKCKLILIGDGIFKKNIENKAKDLKIENKIIFMGQIPNEMVSDLLSAFDVMVFPSRFEGFPNVLVEWQMSGLNCVISDAITKDVKITDLVDFISLKSTAQEWANHIIDIKLNDRISSQEIILNQMKTFGYDIKENAQKVQKEYEKLYEKNYKKN